jgi:hypothetical protein
MKPASNTPVEAVRPLPVVSFTVPQSLEFSVLTLLASRAEAMRAPDGKDTEEEERDATSWIEIEAQGNLKKMKVAGRRKASGGRDLSVRTGPCGAAPPAAELARGRASNKGAFDINFAAQPGSTVHLCDGTTEVSTHSVPI